MPQHQDGYRDHAAIGFMKARTVQTVEQQLVFIERKLDRVISLIEQLLTVVETEQDDEQPQFTLDGQPIFADRKEGDEL